jgi:hypothetical protein
MIAPVLVLPVIVMAVVDNAVTTLEANPLVVSIAGVLVNAVGNV